MKTIMMIITVFALPLLALAESGHGHTEGKHSKMKHEKSASQLAMGKGTVNSVEEGKINISHGPIAALDWPAMKMDLPVTKEVDLSKIKAGDKITFHLALGADKVYRITKIMPEASHGENHSH